MIKDDCNAPGTMRFGANGPSQHDADTMPVTEFSPTRDNVVLMYLALPCHLWPGRAFPPRDCSRRRSAMEGTSADGWGAELERWLGPFLARLRRKAQRRWAPAYLRGLILPGERKSVEPMAARVAPGDTQQLHHFVSTSPWATAPLEDELVKAAGRLVGGPDAVLVVDDTALVKQGQHSVGVKRQYCGQLGKRANCQSLVSLTLARGEVPVGVGLRLFLPEDWCADAERRAAARVPDTVGYRPKWRIALDEIDRVLASGARFGSVLADAEYGRAAEFRRGLAERRLNFAVGIMPAQQGWVLPRSANPQPLQGFAPRRRLLARTYRHLDLDERRTLFRLVEARQPVGEIARRLGRHPSTIHRELGRNRFRDRDRGFCGYFPLNAQDLARRRRQRRRKLAADEGLRTHVTERLKAGW